jgi:hypothetical protein
VLVFLESESSCVLGSMTARYTALADWSEALRRLAILQPAMFGTTTLYAAMAGSLVLFGLATLAILHVLLESPDPNIMQYRSHLPFKKRKEAAKPREHSE